MGQAGHSEVMSSEEPGAGLAGLQTYQTLQGFWFFNYLFII